MIVADGHSLECTFFGPRDAPTLVFLHEGLGSLGQWRDFPQRLSSATGCGALVYSRWGYGRSEPVTLPRPLDYMQREAMASVGEVLDRNDVRDAILVGHSDGGSIAIVHAGSADPRRRVRALMLEAPHVFCEDISVREIARAKAAYETGDLRARLARHHDDVDGAFYGWNRAWLDPAFRAWNIEEHLHGITAPVLVVQGADDPYGTLAQVDAIERGVRGRFERAIVPDCGHAPHREKPEETLRVMTEFVRSVTR